MGGVRAGSEDGDPDDSAADGAVDVRAALAAEGVEVSGGRGVGECGGMGEGGWGGASLGVVAV